MCQAFGRPKHFWGHNRGRRNGNVAENQGLIYQLSKPPQDLSKALCTFMTWELTRLMVLNHDHDIFRTL